MAKLIRFLSILIMNMAPANLASMARALPEPADFFGNLPVAHTQLPEKVLLFTRYKLGLSSPWVHHRFVMIFALDGPGELFLDEQLFRIKPRQTSLIFPFQSHYYGHFSKKKILWLFLAFEFEDETALAVLRNRVFTLSNDDWRKVVEIIAAFHASLHGNPTAQEEIILWLRLLLVALVRRSAKSLSGIPTMTARQKIVQKMTRYIVQHAEHSIHPHEVAQACGVSESHLRRMCRQTLCSSLSKFIRRIRLNRACALIHASTHNFTEIAQACGFSSVFAFSRTFKSEIGVSPCQYRQRVIGGRPDAGLKRR